MGFVLAQQNGTQHGSIGFVVPHVDLVPHDDHAMAVRTTNPLNRS